MKQSTPQVFSGWALPFTVALAAVTWWFKAPWWYVAFQLASGPILDRRGLTPTRARIAGLVTMATMTFMAAGLQYHWAWAGPGVFAGLFIAIGVSLSGERSLP